MRLEDIQEDEKLIKQEEIIQQDGALEQGELMQQSEGIQQEETNQQSETRQQEEKKGITLQEIGKGTVETYKRNPQEASKIMETLERGVAEREDKGNEKQ